MNKLLGISNNIKLCKEKISQQNLIRAFELIKQGNQCLTKSKNDEYGNQEIIDFLKLIESVIKKYTYHRQFEFHQVLADIQKEFVIIVWSQAKELKKGDKIICANLAGISAKISFFDEKLRTNLDQLFKELMQEIKRGGDRL